MTRSFDSLEQFADAVHVLSAEQADITRKRFNDARVDQSLVRELPGALVIKEFSDGPAYEGYLWDFLSDKRVVSEDDLWDAVSGIAEATAMWDLHSADRVRIPGYFRFPRGTVVRAEPETLRAGLAYLPEDLYIFDETYQWAAALTHEYVDNTRFCLWSGNPEANAGG